LRAHARKWRIGVETVMKSLASGQDRSVAARPYLTDLADASAE
jgi:hypothetical protein